MAARSSAGCGLERIKKERGKKKTEEKRGKGKTKYREKGKM
jgi:hypothetical protein